MAGTRKNFNMVDHSQLTEPVKHVVDAVAAATALGCLLYTSDAADE